MAAEEIHVGDVGTQLVVTVKDNTTVVDISSATAKYLTLKKPDGTSLQKSTAFVTDGTDGQMQYTTVSGDLSICGSWKMQGKVEITSGDFNTDITSFKVYRNL
jgi:hypothetical protein